MDYSKCKIQLFYLLQKMVYVYCYETDNSKNNLLLYQIKDSMGFSVCLLHWQHGLFVYEKLDVYCVVHV
mgnify:CR=1 FL=1